MKKTYIIPKIEIVKLKTYNQLLTVSDSHNEDPEEYGAPDMGDDFDW
jgi:hypothetical protein